MDTNRFKYYVTSQEIIDDLTGFRYHCDNKQLVDLLNQVNERGDGNAEKYYQVKERYDECNARKWIMRRKIENYQNILRKYDIHSLNELDEILNQHL